MADFFLPSPPITATHQNEARGSEGGSFTTKGVPPGGLPAGSENRISLHVTERCFWFSGRQTG